MAGYTPPTLPRAAFVVALPLYLLALAYVTVTEGLLLLGLLPAVGATVLYAGWRFLAAFEAIADALERIAHERERE